MEVYKNLNLDNLDDEIWKEIEGYNGYYLISNFGRVKSFKHNKINGKILRQNKNIRGYFVVDLCKNGESENKQIHVLMYEYFIGEIKEGFVVHHIDFTKNNILENFKLMTNEDHLSLHHTGMKHSEETKELIRESCLGKHHAEKTRKLMRENNKGENNSNAILTEQDVIKIRIDLDEGILNQREIGEKFVVDKTTISDIKRKKTWKYIK